MLKKLSNYFVPGENFCYLGSGKRSATFRTESGKIMRIKPIWFGTYKKEANILRFINQNGGLGCKTPDISAFTVMPFAISVHNDFGGKTGDKDLHFDELALEAQKKFAHQLAKSFISLREVGEKQGATKVVKRKKRLFLRQIRYFFFLLNKQKLRKKWFKLQRAYSKKNPVLVLTHNDLHFGNMIVDSHFNLIGLIDFENILFCPFEYNLRKFEKPLSDYIIEYYKSIGCEIDNTVLSYFRAEFYLSRLLMPSNRKNWDLFYRELNDVLDEFIALQ
jgi:hypothetical protein